MKQKSFSGYMREVIRMLESEERFSTAYIYSYALQSFEEFAGGGEMFFGALNRSALKRFEIFLRNKKNSWNTVSTYIRALRAVYNRAIDKRMIDGEYHLFSGVFTGVKSDKKRALESEQVYKLLEGCIENNMDCNHRKDSNKRSQLSRDQQKAQDTFALMLLLQGIPFTDLIHSKQEDLRMDSSGQHILSFRRQKTGSEVNIAVIPEAMTILERYRNQDNSSPYLLKFLDENATGEAKFKNSRHQLRKLNYNLSRLPKLLGVNVKISSYTARHTWATLAKYCGVPEEVISEALGHSSLEVTRTYLKRFKEGTLNKANQIIYNYAFKKEKLAWSMP